MRRLICLCSVIVLLWAASSQAGTITRPGKSFGGTSFITGVIPTAADFNGDLDTAYSEINGSLTNVNISGSAAIAGSKISPAFTLDTAVTTSTPCRIWTESDEAADAQRWYACVSGGIWGLTTRTDAGVIQATPIQINRSTGVITFVAAMIATQAQMETATSTVTIVTPGRVQYHPGVAKGWGDFGNDGTIATSYNVTSITDTAVGRVTVTWATDFSSANYVVLGTAQTTTGGGETCYVIVRSDVAPAAGSTEFDCISTTETLIDPAEWHVVALGDQ